MIKNIPVSFNGIDLVWLKNEDGSGALAYPDHLDEHGDITLEAVFEDSYAHVFPSGVIMRYSQKIGIREDLKPR